MGSLLDGTNLTLGTCYYPEHWDEAMWEGDLAEMKRSGIEVVRVAEFAWSKIEPREGEFEFGFFDRFLDLAQRMGIRVIFSTPTATPPAWLTEQYPEVLNATIDGALIRHGSRRHYNYNSEIYRKYVRRIVEKSASRYGKHPAVIGWQIDNEFNCENYVFYSESDTVAFRGFLKDKYGTVERLNRAWGTVFWNQTYTAWSEVHLPRRTNTGAVNPHLALDYTRFISHSVRSFAGMQADIVRRYIKPGDFVTTNGMFGHIDNHALTRESLDFYTYDSYPNFAYCVDGFRPEEPMKDRWSSRSLAEVRSVSPRFGIMEQQTGANGWNVSMEAPTPRPGQMTLWTMQSIAHGADFISYFRWRTCPFGTEMYWHGILDYSGRENRRLREVREIHKKLEKLQELAGSVYCARVAILRDYDNIWDAELDHWHGRIDRLSQDSLFTAMQQLHVTFDYLYLPTGEEAEGPAAGRNGLPPERTAGAERHEKTDSEWLEQMARYGVLFYPHPVILTKRQMNLLESYVEAGGKLVFGCRTGQKDIHGICVTDCLPGLASELTGTDVLEYSLVAPDDGTIYAEWDGARLTAPVFNDLLAAAGERAEVLATYRSSYYAGTPALVRSWRGRGEVYYFGGAFGTDTARIFLQKLGAAEPWQDAVSVPEGCELAVREKGERKYFFILNYLADETDIEVKVQMQDLFSGQFINGVQRLEGYGVRVYRMG